MDNYNIYKEFGLGNFKKNGTEIIFNLEPIDVIMIKYSKNSSKSYYLLIIFIIIIIIIIIAAMIFIFKRYLNKKVKTKIFIDSVSKLMNEWLLLKLLYILKKLGYASNKYINCD